MRKLLLAFNGGGCRAASTAVWLERLIKSGHIELEKVFSFSGTSSGSIIAASLCKPDPIDPSQLSAFSAEISRAIFSEKKVNWLPH